MVEFWKSGMVMGGDPIAEAATTAKLDPEVKALIETNNHDAVEDLLLSRIDTCADDLQMFIPVLRHFVRNNKTESASMFFDLLIEAYRNRKLVHEEISLLRAILAVWPGSESARIMLLDHLRSLYSDSPNFKRLVEYCKVVESPDPLVACRRLENWLRYDVGCGVYMPSKGVGRVREINLNLGNIRVEFAPNEQLISFKPDEAERLMEPLPAGHFLLEKLNKPTELQKLALADPGELLRRLFTSVERPVAFNEIKDILTGIVDPAQWTAWWASARKDRRLTVSISNLCTWNDSAADADSVLLQQFMVAPVRERLDLARKFAKRSAVLASSMTAELLKDAELLRTSDGALALELYLALEKLPGGAGNGDRAEDVAELIHHADAAEFVRQLSDRVLRKRGLVLLRELRDDWPSLYARLIKTEADASSLALLYESLKEFNPASVEELAEEIMSSPANAPDFFIWLCRDLLERRELVRFANWGFLQLILRLLQNNAIKNQNASLRKLFDEDGTFHRIARTIEPEQAKQLIGLIERDPNIEEYRRVAMLKDLRAWYPENRQITEKTFFVSASSLKIRHEEYVKITTVDIPHNTEEIIKARAHGDLRENFEYHAARTRQELLSSRAKSLHDELQFARPIDMTRVDPSTVCVGTRVQLVTADGIDAVMVTVLGPWDSDPAKNVLSYMAPAAQGMFGKRKGDEVAFNDKTYVIAEIFLAEEGGGQ